MIALNLTDDVLVGPNWEAALTEFHDSCGDLRLNGYGTATHEITTVLNCLLRQATTLEEFKKELFEFVDDRTRFLEILDRGFDHKTGEYHL